MLERRALLLLPERHPLTLPPDEPCRTRAQFASGLWAALRSYTGIVVDPDQIAALREHFASGAAVSADRPDDTREPEPALAVTLHTLHAATSGSCQRRRHHHNGRILA